MKSLLAPSRGSQSNFMRRRNPGMAKFALWRRRISLESGSSRPRAIRPPESRPERQERFPPASHTIPPLACECYGRGQSGEAGKGMTATVEFEEGSFELPDDLVAIWKSFGAPLASTRKGTLRIGSGVRGLSIELDIPSTSWGDDIVTASAGVEIYARPLFDASEIEASEIVRNGETIARLSRVPVRAILVGPTPNSRGWPEVDITPSEDRQIPFSRRERYAWL